VRWSLRVLAVALVLVPTADGTGPEKPMKATLVRYSGMVQGVGFRATAVTIARDHPVVGFVKNLPDGRVELWAEGPPADVEKFLKAIRDHWQDDITKEEAEARKPTGNFKRFEIMR
jgi:acylphosphatase